MSIITLIDSIKALPNCVVFPPAGMPKIALGYTLPTDLYTFYEYCGGMDLFCDSVFPTRIATPETFLLANPVIFADIFEEELEVPKDDPSSSWYLIGYGLNSQYLTVDLEPSRLGHYYNSFWTLHSGNSESIASSLEEFLAGLLSTQGEYYWFDS